ncbi:hypothetical protein [Thiohalorhabdus sp.]|uniref:hypothetical protein n=1 Tax=Thiohalorhabdus sp. TaxID=3094134 RepID=UPI002FC3CD19
MGEVARQGLAWLAALAAAAFGAVTLQAGGGVLFGPEAARQAAGAYLPFVVWFNFAAGFAYLIGAGGLFLRARWALRLALALAGATLAVYAAFGVHVLNGGAFEIRTVVALAVRTAFWLAMAWVARLVSQ